VSEATFPSPRSSSALSSVPISGRATIPSQSCTTGVDNLQHFLLLTTDRSSRDRCRPPSCRGQACRSADLRTTWFQPVRRCYSQRTCERAEISGCLNEKHEGRCFRRVKPWRPREREKSASISNTGLYSGVECQLDCQTGRASVRAFKKRFESLRNSASLISRFADFLRKVEAAAIPGLSHFDF